MSDKSTIVRFIQSVAPVASTLAPAASATVLARLFTTPIRHRTPQRERDWLADARRSRIRFDRDRDLAVYTWGEGPTVLLAHGWAGRGSQLGAFAEPLRQRGFKVVAFDAPGHGRADGRQSALPEFATAVQRLEEALGPFHAIIAHSIGTAATTVALHRGVNAGRLVYLSPPERPANYLDRAASMLGFSEAVARRTQMRLEKQYGVEFDDARGSKLAVDMRTPLLVIHDAEDAEVPFAEGRRLADAWPGAELMTVHGLGHTRLLRDAAVVAAAVDFVGEPTPHTMLARS